MWSFALVILMSLHGHGQVYFSEPLSNCVVLKFCDFTVVFQSSLRSCAYEVQSSVCQILCVRPMIPITTLILMYGLCLFVVISYV